jgi:hypothetical protein
MPNAVYLTAEHDRGLTCGPSQIALEHELSDVDR